jgi:hypothetical protein
MQWSLYPAKSRFDDFAQAWDRLNQRLFFAHPLFDSRFVSPLVRHFATERDILALYEHDVGCDSMLLLTPRRVGVWETFLPSQTQVSPILPDERVDLCGLLRCLPGVNVALDLLCQDPLYSTLPLELTLPPRALTPHAVTVNIKLGGDFDQYWQSRSKNLRANLRRRFRRVSEDGLEVRLDVVTQLAQLEKAFTRYGNIESQSWKGKTGTAIHRENSQGQFYWEMLQGFAQDNQAAIYELYLDERLAASMLTLTNAYMLITLKTTYDESLALYAPGRLLDYLLLEREFAEKRYSVVEYYTNAAPALQSWGTGTRTINHITVYRARVFKQLMHAYQRAKQFGHEGHGAERTEA